MDVVQAGRQQQQPRASVVLKLCIAIAGGSKKSQEHLVEPHQLAEMGTRFLHILTTMKHNGAIDKTQAGFTALVQR